jgi:hypothetical protein
VAPHSVWCQIALTPPVYCILCVILKVELAEVAAHSVWCQIALTPPVYCILCVILKVELAEVALLQMKKELAGEADSNKLGSFLEEFYDAMPHKLDTSDKSDNAVTSVTLKEIAAKLDLCQVKTLKNKKMHLITRYICSIELFMIEKHNYVRYLYLYHSENTFLYTPYLFF